MDNPQKKKCLLLKDRFKIDGNWLFAYRSYVPLCFVVFFLVALFAFSQYLIYPEDETAGSSVFKAFLEGQTGDDYSMEYNTLLVCLALFIGLLGQFIRILVAGVVPKGTSGRNTKGQVANSLNTTGMYSICRNPLYLGNFFMWCAPLVLLGNWLLLFAFALSFWLIYERIIYAEEDFLLQKFGDTYKQWVDNTPCFIPKLSNFKKSELSFSFASCLKREYHSLFGLASALLIVSYIIAVETLRDFTVLPEPILSVFFILSLILYLVMVVVIKLKILKLPTDR